MEVLTVLVPYILRGLSITLEVTAIALGFGLFFGAILAILRVYGGKILSRVIGYYVTILRALPHILLLLVIYFMIARVVNLSAFWAGSVSLAIISSAYQAEIIRGAIQSVPGGQMMAARSIGMNRFKAIWYVIIPQAFRHAIPPWSNEAAIVIKDSSLVYILGVPEILRQAQYYSARTYKPFTAYVTVAAIYFLLTFITNRGLDAVERRIRIPA
ncbi:MAG: amino acid ABC transporter permease [Anaerolineaceae bacterium]|jgi:polar amino acid transport system permease protein|nr:amino acid ABC transporter permease [Anaerolineaceae bacterium]